MSKNTLKQTNSTIDNIDFEKISKDKILISGFENFKKPQWNNENTQNFKKSLHANNESFRFIVEAIDSLKAQFKMTIKKLVIPESEGKQLIEALDKIYKELQTNRQVDASVSVYEYIEKRVKEIAPEAYGWFYVARSSNAQKAGDTMYWTRGALSRIEHEIQKLLSNLLEKAESSVKTIYPGRAHGQLSQPISFGYYLMGYVQSFARDLSRIRNAIDHVSQSPYMVGYMSGNSFQTSPDMVAKQLNFPRAASNAVDAVASRDFALEALSAISIAATNVSKLAKDLHRWHSTECGYISFSSIYVDQHDASPFKRDLRYIESILSSCKSIPYYFNAAASITSSFGLEASDELDKISEHLVDAYDEFFSSLKGITSLVADFTINTKAMKEAAYKNFSVALDLVDYIIQTSKCDMFQAQSITRNMIDYSILKGKKLSLLELDEIKQFIPKADDAIYSVLIPSRAIITRRSYGGSNPVQVRKSIRIAKRNYL